MVLVSVAYADLGMVASEHARTLFPPELRPKVRAQSEGFPLPQPVGDRRAARARLGLPVAGPLIGFFGRTLESVRGFDIFLQVAKRVRAVRPDVRVLVIGSEGTLYGNEERYLGQVSFKQYALQQAGVREGDLIWRDFLPYGEFLAHIGCLDLAILPTFEGASNWSFFDAMASGLPILSSNRSYVPELLEDGRDGYLFDPYDVEGFVAAALRLLDQPLERARIGGNARERIHRDHTPERVAEGYERIAREALALRRQRRPAEAWV
jgi:glycosyltransferase involved in cell wall biosynthesis